MNKTNYILFKMKNKTYSMNDKIKIDHVELKEVTRTKFLGVIINHTLTWKDHIMLIKQKIAKNLGIISRVRYCLPR